jgi:hypothetical protein
MKIRLFQSIIELYLKIGATIDESSPFRMKRALVICIITVFPDSSEPSTFSFDLVKLNNTSASAILDSVLSCYHKHGFKRESFVKCNLLATDGASNKLG